MPKQQKRLTKRQLKELHGKGPSGSPKTKSDRHIHCIACGRHIEPSEFTSVPAAARMLTCLHGSQFPSCVRCVTEAQARIDEHDRTGKEPRIAAVWH